MIGKSTAESLGNFFLSHEETISVAESVTSGLLQLLFSSIKDAERFFQGGITAYNIGQKYKHLSVEPIHAYSCNCVSAKVAEQMSLEVCKLFNSDWGIGVTGYATPVKESKNKIYCHFALSHKGKVKTSEKVMCENMSPASVQKYYCKKIIDRLVKTIKTEE